MEYINIEFIKDSGGRNALKKRGVNYQVLIGREGFNPTDSGDQRWLIEELNYYRKRNEKIESEVDERMVAGDLNRLREQDLERVQRIRIS